MNTTSFWTFFFSEIFFTVAKLPLWGSNLIKTTKNNSQLKTITSDKNLYENIILKTIKRQVQSWPIRFDARQLKNYLIKTDKNNWQFKTITSDKKLYGNIILKTIEIQVQSWPIWFDARQLKIIYLRPINIIDNSKQ